MSDETKCIEWTPEDWDRHVSDMEAARIRCILGQDAKSSYTMKASDTGNEEVFSSEFGYYSVTFTSDKKLNKTQLAERMFSIGRQLLIDAPPSERVSKKIRGGEAMDLIQYSYKSECIPKLEQL